MELVLFRSWLCTDEHDRGLCVLELHPSSPRPRFTSSSTQICILSLDVSLGPYRSSCSTAYASFHNLDFSDNCNHISCSCGIAVKRKIDSRWSRLLSVSLANISRIDQTPCISYGSRELRSGEWVFVRQSACVRVHICNHRSELDSKFDC